MHQFVIDRIIMATQPEFSKTVNLFPTSSSSFSPSWALDNSRTTTTVNRFQYFAGCIQRWIQEVAERNNLMSDSSSTSTTLFKIESNQSYDSAASSPFSLQGFELIRLISSLQLSISFKDFFPVIGAFLELLSAEQRQSKNNIESNSESDNPFIETVSDMFVTLLTLSTSIRHLQLEMKATSSTRVLSTENRQNQTGGNSFFQNSAGSSSHNNDDRRLHWRILHTCQFTLDCLLRFITTELQQILQNFEQKVEIILAARNEQNSTMSSLFDLLDAFDEFQLKVRDLAVASSSSHASTSSSPSKSIVDAISPHVATLCSIACSTEERMKIIASTGSKNEKNNLKRKVISYGDDDNDDDDGDDDDVNDNENDRDEEMNQHAGSGTFFLERTLQRVDLACRSMVSVLKGLRVETDDSSVEKRASALLATLTFNSFY